MKVADEAEAMIILREGVVILMIACWLKQRAAGVEGENDVEVRVGHISIF
jgi:hypothetical protein